MDASANGRSSRKFDGVVVSGLERFVKPDPHRLFRVFCERYGLARLLFIDDNEANVVSARKYGMAAVHFTNPAALRAELVSYGLPLKGWLRVSRLFDAGGLHGAGCQ